MDKEILRIVIIATGMVVVIGMLVWAYIKDKKAREDLEFYDDDSDESLAADTSVDTEDDFDIIPLGAAKGNVGGHQAHDKADRYYDENEDEDYYEQDDDVEPPPRAAAPAIIQFSIITKADEDFNGADLV
ncbi:MAG: cell division protein, partial [Methylobacter tundripaludum]|nr:cell division protein [Methylobacter tundripaludum]